MSRVQLGTLGIAALVALRVGIGLHFFYQGTDKLHHPKPFSAGFLGNAKGPLAPYFKSLVWDPDGERRLDYDATTSYWSEYGQQVARHYNFDDKQSKEADAVVKNYSGRLRNYLGSRSAEQEEYYAQLERRDKNAKDPARQQLASFQAHDAKITGERMKLKGQLLPGIDAIWKDVERDLNGIATSEQWKAHGSLPIGKVGRRFGDSETVDQIIPYFDLFVGMLLVVGLFVRPAAILAGLFLLSVCASQWPGAIGAAPIEFQANEMLACFVLAAVGAGNLAGLDFFLATWWDQRKKPAAAPGAGGKAALAGAKKK